MQLSLVTGAHRSGTTWIGKMLAGDPAIGVIHEPLNLDYGMRHADQWYPCADDLRQAEIVRAVIEPALNGRGRYKARPSDPLLKRVTRSLTGGPDEWRYRNAMRWADHLVFKDPFAVLSSAWLARQYDMQVVVMVRHPCAYLASLKRMSWMPPTQIVADNLYPEGRPRELEDRISQAQSFAERTGLFWSLIYGHVLKAREVEPERILLMRHEDVSTAPDAYAPQLLDHLRINRREGIVERFRSSTSGEIVSPPEGVIHAFERDAYKMVSFWREKLTEDEIADVLRTASGPLEALYNDAQGY